jgi:hypothetical protein
MIPAALKFPFVQVRDYKLYFPFSFSLLKKVLIVLSVEIAFHSQLYQKGFVYD